MVTDEEFQNLKNEVAELKQLVHGSLPKIKENLSEAPTNEEKIKRFADEVGVTQEALKTVFDFNDNDVNLIALIDGRNEVERQLNATLCLLTAYTSYCKVDTVQSEKLRLKLEKLGIKSLTNLSTNLKGNPNYLVCDVGKSTKDSTYKITYPGIKKGLEIIRQLINKGG